MKTRIEYLQQIVDELEQLEEQIELAKVDFLNAPRNTRHSRMKALAKIIEKKIWLKEHINSLQMNSGDNWEEARVELEESWDHLREAWRKLRDKGYHQR